MKNLSIQLLKYNIVCGFDEDSVAKVVFEYFYLFCNYLNNYDGYKICVKCVDIKTIKFIDYYYNDHIVSYNDKHKKIVYVYYSDEASRKELGVFVIRIIRALFRFYLSEDGWIMTHAAAYWNNNSVHLLVGNKHEGKTFTLIQKLLNDKESDFISNDKVFIKYANNHLYTISIPYKVCVRISTLLSNPQLLKCYNNENMFYKNVSLDFIENAYKDIDVNGDIKVKYTCHEFVDLLNTKIINGELETNHIEKVGVRTNLEYDKLFFSYEQEPLLYLSSSFQLSQLKEKIEINLLIPEIEKRLTYLSKNC